MRTPLFPPPKEIDACAKASAVGEVKNAVKESAGGCHRIALPNKKGPGWDVDGLDGEIQAASAEVHSLLKHPNAYQHQGDHQGGFTCDVNEAAMRYLATTGMGDPAPPLKTPQGSFVGQDETIGNVNEAAMRDLATTGMGNPAAPVKSPQHSRALLTWIGSSLPTHVCTILENTAHKPSCTKRLAKRLQTSWGSIETDWLRLDSPNFLSALLAAYGC